MASLRFHITAQVAGAMVVSFYLLLPAPFPPHSLTLLGASLSRDRRASKKQPISLGEGVVLGNEWSTTSKAGRSLMLNRVEKELEVVACKMGHVRSEPPSRVP